MTVNELIELTNKRIQQYMKEATSKKSTFPSWKELTDISTTNAYICEFTAVSQHVTRLISDAKVWLVKIGIFKDNTLQEMQTLSRTERATYQSDMKQLVKSEEYIKEVIPSLTQKYYNTIECINSLKLISKTMID